MLVKNTDESRQNIHWQSQYYICNICQVPYDFIVHTEDNDQAKNRIMQSLGLPPLPSKEEYYGGKNNTHKSNTILDANLENDLIKQLYRRLYIDFLVLGYGPDDVTDYLK